MNYEELSDFEINKSADRFNDKWMIIPPSDCWIWEYGVNKKGYGLFWFVDRTHQAHRVSYRLFKGRFPSELCVLHKCDNPSCVNPDHLFIGTNADNAADMRSKNRGPDMKGSKNGRSKLSEVDIPEIKSRLNSGESGASIARDYGIAQTSISRIKTGFTWGNV